MHLKRSYWRVVDFTIDKLNLLVPITIIPAVGLLILSTSARFIHVNDVISKFTGPLSPGCNQRRQAHERTARLCAEDEQGRFAAC